MIDQTFLHCPGIGPKKEIHLKSLGFHCWQDCLEQESKLPFSGAVKETFLQSVRDSLAALEREDLFYLTRRLPNREHWRILSAYYPEATYFDIETTGLSSFDSFITVITAYYQGELFNFCHGDNLDDFLELVDRSRLLVAFNGNSFDIPFLENSFRIPHIGCPYIDLRWICYYQGYTGGLKSIEKQMCLKRPFEIQHIDGFEAVHLFNQWQKGDATAGRKLIRYCESDVLATYLTAGRLLQEMGQNVTVPEPESFFQMTGKIPSPFNSISGPAIAPGRSRSAVRRPRLRDLV